MSNGLERMFYVQKPSKPRETCGFFLFKSEKIYPMPVFRNYEELKDFLTVGYQLQEDITAAFLKAQGISD